ncbi:MAG: ATP-dependent DNA ligase [Patescibacteria group bacterium]|nr:ATP-dependent DNA ligase [Patescibacteria group bacterium]
MKFSCLADYFQNLEKTASRIEITKTLASLLKEASSAEVDKICYLSLGRLAPLYAGVEFNMADKMMLKVLSRAFGVSQKETEKEFRKKGDLGQIAFDFANKASNKSKNLEVTKVYERLLAIAQDSGEKSVERKIAKMAELFLEVNPLSVKFLARIPVSKLRLGFSEATLMDALSWMLTQDKSKREEIEKAFNSRADIGQIARAIKTKGITDLKNIKAQLGVPIMPGLTQRLANAQEIIKKMGKVAVEGKYDGQRIQIHFSKTKKEEKEDISLFETKPKYYFRTYTRSLENNTHMFPDLAKVLEKEIKAKEVILDGEAIGINLKTGEFLPFQETMKRKRKHSIGETAKKIPLKFFCFDIMFIDGKSLMSEAFEKRRKILEKVLPRRNKKIVISPQILTSSPKVLLDYHKKQIEKGLEGIVAKKWQAPYEPGKRGFTWVKLKQETQKKGAGLADTLDLIVMGYFSGQGKRAGFGIGKFLVGVRQGENFLTVSKIGTGLSDDQWKEMKKRCDKAKVNKKPTQYKIGKTTEPDVWCSPQIVVEIQADNITRSSLYTSGLSLRFPRLVRFREDKTKENSSSISELKSLFDLQANIS